MTKNFGVDTSVFEKLPSTNPYIFNGTIATQNVTAGANGYLSGSSSFVYRTLEHPAEVVPGNGGEFRKIDSTNFPISKTIAATFVTLKPGGLRELHWHPNVRAHSCPGLGTGFLTLSRPKSGCTSTRAKAAPPSSSATQRRGRLTSPRETRPLFPTTPGESAPLFRGRRAGFRY